MRDSKIMDALDQDKKVLYEKALKQLEEAGAKVIDHVSIPSSSREWSYDVLTHEFKANLNAYLARLEASVANRTLKEIIMWNRENKETALAYGQSLLELSELTSGSLTETDYLNALYEDDYYSKRAGIDVVLTDHELDALVFPNNLGAAIPAKAGYPSLTVPAGYTEAGEPVGITFTAKAWGEPLLIEIAEAYEQATKARRPPFLLARLSIKE
ncbi:amidase family protein [Alkalihalophilus lindianensis]|uniref:Amidase family protein n=1 Tax=Alkalihalophilus lindianensis TaxID=1630542 RepID=A0ABU3XD81_9BACI|nr:amidase family protein [Alkalihalophilus lindianensis]MDV2685798.1 amidase family protein [Alkalihalophilus lindianensis]